MGRPPCCDKEGVKKGPWTPEEDILLVSYVQQHGPGNWRAVPSNTGLLRCSKSCRLRWANYLRPGIKRGSFTQQEEKMIIHLQALLGNRWAAIASYLPQRTDNDIKNYWNTHLKKKLKKQQLSNHYQQQSSSTLDILSSSTSSSENPRSSSRGQWEKRLQTNIHMAKQALCDALSSMDQQNPPNTTNLLNLVNPSSSSTSFPNHKQRQQLIYASSTENIARLLRNWSRNAPKKACSSSTTMDQPSNSCTNGNDYAQSSSEDPTRSNEEKFNMISNNNDISNRVGYDETFRSLFGSNTIESTTSPDSDFSETSLFEAETKPFCDGGRSKLSMLEKWLFDDCNFVHHCDDDLELTDLPLQETADFL